MFSFLSEFFFSSGEWKKNVMMLEFNQSTLHTLNELFIWVICNKKLNIGCSLADLVSLHNVFRMCKSVRSGPWQPHKEE